MNHNQTFNDILIEVKKYMILEDSNDYIIDVILSTSLSLELNRPIWIMITAPPSSGKTELLNLLNQTDNFHKLHNLTPKFLFSGYVAAQGGYVPREIKEKGVIAFPDFTTVLSLNSKSRNEIFNQLRVMYDGEAGLGTGMDLGQYESWKGKVVVIGLVTEVIEKVKERISDLGERFLYFNYNSKELTNEELQNFRPNEDARENVPYLVQNLLTYKINEVQKIEINQEDIFKIVSLAKFISIGRAIVERSGYNREIEQVISPEKPHRIIEALSSFYKSLICINENKERTMTILHNITFSSIPKVRMNIIAKILRCQKKSLTLENIMEGITIFSESKIRRAVEDLFAQGILNKERLKNGNIYIYKLSDNYIKIWNDIIGK
ncbi:MAG: hypothetical protein ACYC56_12945 [Candidatus Aquicultor sp.]